MHQTHLAKVCAIGDAHEDGRRVVFDGSHRPSLWQLTQVSSSAGLYWYSYYPVTEGAGNDWGMLVGELSRRDELVDFLRTRRARVPPEEVGLVTGKRRRTPGLRREEVAQLASISTVWYTWLEQGRDVHVSVDVLESLVRALRLGESERAHLFDLAGRALPPPEVHPGQTVQPLAAVCEIIDRTPDPVYLQDSLWRMVRWNRAATAVFADFESLPPEDRNLMRFVFISRTRTHATLLNWQEWARFYVAQFRADTTRFIGDPEWAKLFDDLSQNREFRTLWAAHDVRGRLHPQPKELEHHTAGRLVLDCTTFRVDAQPELTLVIHTPVPDTGTHERLEALLQSETMTRG